MASLVCKILTRRVDLGNSWKAVISTTAKTLLTISGTAVTRFTPEAPSVLIRVLGFLFLTLPRIRHLHLLLH